MRYNTEYGIDATTYLYTLLAARELVNKQLADLPIYNYFSVAPTPSRMRLVRLEPLDDLKSTN